MELKGISVKTEHLHALWVFVVSIAAHVAAASEPVSLKFDTMPQRDVVEKPQVDHSRGFLVAGTDELEQGLADFDKAIDLEPQNANAFRNRGQYWSNKLETSKALRDFDEAIRLDPNHAPTYIQRGLHRALKRRWDEAFADLDEALRLNPDDAETYFQRALISVSKQDREQAIVDLDVAIRIDPNHVLAYSCRGWQWMTLGQFDQAIDDFSDVLRLDPHNSSAYRNRAIARMQKREFAKALLDALATDELNPRMMTTNEIASIAKESLRAADLKLAKRTDETTDDLGFAAAYRERGIAYRALERWKEALDNMDEAIRLDQSSSSAYGFRGRLWLQERQWDRAIDDLDTAIQMNPGIASVWRDRGVARMEQKEWAAACDDFTHAIQIDPLDRRTIAWRGAASQARGELDCAIVDYDQVTRGVPFYVHAPRPRWQDEQPASPNKSNRDAPGPTTKSNSVPDGWTSTHYADLKPITNISKYLDGILVKHAVRTATRSQHSQSGNTTSRATRPDEISRTSHTICLDPVYLMAFNNRALCQKTKGNWANALDDHQELIRLAPADSRAYRHIAWLKATCPDPEYRNGEEAVQYAMLAAERSRTVADCVALAAAYAELGDFEKAIEYQSQARDLAAETWEKEIQARRQHLKAMEFEWPIDGDDDNPARDDPSAVNVALKACENSLWKEAKSIEILSDAYATAGHFDEAIDCLNKFYVLTVEGRDKPLLDTLELYHAGTPFRANRLDGSNLVDDIHSTSFTANLEVRIDDEVVCVNGIAVEALSLAQIRLLSLDPKSEPTNNSVHRDRVENVVEVDPSTGSDPFPTASQPDAKDSHAETVEAASQALPQVLDGFVVDANGTAVKNATVTLKIYRGKYLFETTPAGETENWTATTNDDGAYKLLLGEQFLAPDDDLVVQTQADGYRPLDSNIDRMQVLNGTLPKQQLVAETKNRLVSPEHDPWDGWEDDTSAFNAEVAATVNGVPVLNGQLIDRYSGYLNSVRKEMQNLAKASNLAQPGEPIPTPKDFERFRPTLVQRDLPAHVQKTVLVQYLMASLTREQRIQVDRHIDNLFEKELDKLKQELKASNIEELESELCNRGTSLNNVKANFALDRLSVECVVVKAKPFVTILDREILDYYQTHVEQFEVPQTVDWRRIGVRISPSLTKAEAKEKLEQILVRLKQGDSFDEIVRSFSKAEGVYSQSWEGTATESFVDRELRSQLNSHPLNQWSPMIEERPSSPANEPVAREMASKPTFSLIGSKEIEDRLKDDHDVATKTIVADTKSGFGLRHNVAGLYWGTNPFGFQVDPVVEPEKSFSNVNSRINLMQIPQNRTEVYVVCVTARHEAHGKPIEEVRETIRITLTNEQNAKRVRKFINKVFSTAKIESSYSLPQFTYDESPADSNEPPELEPLMDPCR